MARLTFRQGIYKHQKDNLNNQWFLIVSGGYVTLNVSPDPTIISFVHGTSDYLYTESTTVPNAWGPFTATPGLERWLYWDLNLVDGLRTFGFTTHEPVEQSTAPAAPAVGKMWFNTTQNKWFEWNGASWVNKVRVFACKLDAALTPWSMSISAPLFTGTQVGLTTVSYPGALAFDATGAPIKKGNGQFFTTEDKFTTGVSSAALLRVGNIIVSAQAQQPLAAYNVVQFSDFNKCIPATPVNQGIKVFGIIEEDATTGEVVNFITEGVIYNDDWDWLVAGASVNDPIYINFTGQLTRFPVIPNQLPVGSIIDRQRILFAPKVVVSGSGSGSSPTTFLELTDTPADYTGNANAFARVNSTADGITFFPDPGYITSVSWGDIAGSLTAQTDLQTALNGKVSLSGSTMSPGADLVFNGGEVTGLPTVPSDPSSAASKAYVDSVATGHSWKNAVRVATTGPGTLSTSFAAGQTIDDVVLVAGDRILIKDQAIAAENGIYVVNSSGAPTRAADMDSAEEFDGAAVLVQEGTVNETSSWTQTETVTVVGTSDVLWVQFGAGGSSSLAGLSDVSITGGASGDILVRDAFGVYQNRQINHIHTYNSGGSGDITLGYIVNHNLGQEWVTVQIYTNSGSKQLIIPDVVELNDANNCTITLNEDVDCVIIVTGVLGASTGSN